MSYAIKFRLWEEGEFDYWTPLSFETLIDWGESQRRTYDGNGSIDVKGRYGPEKSEQWIGLLDKNGVEIYVGDLVNFTQRWCNHGPEPEDWVKQEVYYDDECAAFLFGREHGIGILDNVDVRTLEVVGNIHQ